MAYGNHYNEENVYMIEPSLCDKGKKDYYQLICHRHYCKRMHFHLLKTISLE